MTIFNKSLHGFVPIDEIPKVKMNQSSWISDVIDELMVSDEHILCAAYKDIKQAQNKQQAIRSYLKNNNLIDQFHVCRRQNTIYIEKLSESAA